MFTRRRLSPAILAITALLLCASSQAKEAISLCRPQAKQVIAQSFPSVKSEKNECAKGDLDQDGIPDVAAIIQYTSADGIELAQVLILKGSAAGSYSIIAKSDVCGPHILREEEVLIRRGSVYLTANTHSYDEYAVTTYQFKFDGKEFVLIGLDEARGIVGKDRSSSSRTVNFKNGKLIETQRSPGRKIVQERRVATPPHIRLQEFTLDNVGGMVFKDAE